MKKYGLIGEKLGHSFSPLIHNKLGHYEYKLCQCQRDELKKLLADQTYGGFNVTIPYKKTVMDFCQRLTDEAKAIGAVNTMVREKDGTWTGHNTDYYGFVYLLNKNKIDPRGKKALVLGSGGASLTVQKVLKDLEASQVVVVSRKGENNYENIAKNFDSQIIINTTPVGMYPNNGVAPINLDDFLSCDGVVDLIYNPNRTKLLFDAKRKSIPCASGLEMLVAQAKKASELFQGKEISDLLIPIITSEIKEETQNLIYIGMPGSGKTTLGSRKAKEMGRKFVDIDSLIMERCGMSIPDIFAEQGEGVFRTIETEVLADVCKESGLVIATGGGVVTKRINYNILKQNGTVIWVMRDLDRLDIKGRPLSQKGTLENMYEERKHAYSYWSDISIRNEEEK
ncbi:MAG: shikimate kinase [Anaerovoracaceae bacterium]